MSRVTRPLLRYHGGKWKMAPWIQQYFPPHVTYVEPFGGGASVLLRKEPSDCEVYNDLDARIVGLFRVLRNPAMAEELHRRLALTPYARVELDDSYVDSDDPVEQARKVIVRSMMGHGSRGATSVHRTGFRTTRRERFSASHDWVSYVDSVPRLVRRLRSVIIEQRQAAEVIQAYDDRTTLHYVDPPYPHSTRSSKVWQRAYLHEMSDNDHRDLASVLHSVQGMVVVSGYPSALYDSELYVGWERHERRAYADGRQPRTEVIWMNPACSVAQRAEHATPLWKVGGAQL